MSYVNGRQMKHVIFNLRDVATAIMDGETVWQKDPVYGWVKVQQLNVDKPRSDYHVGEVAPE